MTIYLLTSRVKLKPDKWDTVIDIKKRGGNFFSSRFISGAIDLTT